MFSSMDAEVVSLVVYFYIYVVDVDMVAKNGCSYVLSCLKTCVSGRKFRSHSIRHPHLEPFSIRNAFINSRSSTVNGAIIYA